MAILEEYDWMLINELSFKIHTTSDTKEMRQTVLTCLNQIISFDMASFYPMQVLILIIQIQFFIVSVI